MADQYATTVCPHCTATLEPLPRAKKCPSCGHLIYVRSAPDVLRHLLREDQLPALEAAWVSDHAARSRAEKAEREAEARRLLAATLASYRAAGVRAVSILTDEASCADCRKFAGHVFDLRTAPVLPYVRCRNESCRCDYLPVMPE